MLDLVRRKTPSPATAAVAVGGVGGSGTRLVAQLLLELGFYLGSDLNESNDNVWFALLFTRPETLGLSKKEFDYILDIYLQALTTNGAYTSRQLAFIRRLVDPSRRQALPLLRAYCDSLCRQHTYRKGFGPWGWKAPNTHVFIDRFIAALPNIKYIHVARNGLDMAFSTNQNQLHLWGAAFLGHEVEITPPNSLKFWVTAHRRVARLCAPIKENFYLLNFDQLCQQPSTEIARLLGFLDIQPGEEEVAALSQLVVLPKSTGRFKEHDLGVFDEEDVCYVEQLGFDVSYTSPVQA